MQTGQVNHSDCGSFDGATYTPKNVTEKCVSYKEFRIRENKNGYAEQIHFKQQLSFPCERSFLHRVIL